MEPASSATSALRDEGESRLLPRPISGASAGEPLVFERLEYGKLCSSPDGPILAGVESYPLAISPGFEKSVADFCRPWKLGTGQEVVPGAPHATVLRCMLNSSGTAHQVFFRIRQRSEDGEGTQGRRFWRARYLWCREGVASPLGGFEALEALGPYLRGMTSEEARQPCQSMRWPQAFFPEPDSLLEAFLERALELVLSGIPIGIANCPDERSFFRQAAALWHLLPPPLQPLLSAGWAVPPAQTRELHLSASPTFPPNLAVFDQHRWRLPSHIERAQTKGETRSRPFDDEDLVPGRMFLRESFEWTADGHPRLFDQRLPLDHLKGLDYGLGGSKEPIVDAGSAWSRNRFRRPGIRSLDHARAKELDQWLAGAFKGDEASLCLSTNEYFFSGARQEVLTLALTAMGSEGGRARGDEVVWRSFKEDPGSHALLDQIRISSKLVGARSRLMRAQALGEWQPVLDSLIDTIESEAALGLPPESVKCLSRQLTASLDHQESTSCHQRLLTAQPIPGPYLDWVKEKSARLAVALGTSEAPGMGVALGRLEEISSSQAVSAMRHLKLNEKPSGEDIDTLKDLSQADVALLARNLMGLWSQKDQDAAERRNALFPWFEPLLPLLGPAAQADPLFATLFPWPDKPDPRLLEGLAEEVRGERVPKLLEIPVAVVVLRHWDIFQPRFYNGKDPKPWRVILSNWPDEAILALAGPGMASRPGNPAPKIQRALKELQLSVQVLDELIARHLDLQMKKGVYNSASKLLWELCTRCRSTGDTLTAAWTCRLLSECSLPEAPPEQGQQDLVCRLARSIHFELQEELWLQAKQAWQIRFLLELAPAADLKPTLQQLSQLIRERYWLQRHLERKGIHPKRYARYEIACADFHERFRSRGWRPEYAKAPLWAAFKDVPLDDQDDLYRALRAYSDSTTDLLGHAVTYLDNRRDPKDFPAVCRLVTRAAIVPFVRRGDFNIEDLAHFFENIAQEKSLLGTLLNFLSTLLGLGRDKKKATELCFRPLLEKLWRLDARREVLDEVRHAMEPPR